VTSLEFRDRLARRARRAKAPLTIAMLDPLETYYRLLAHWNKTINLTALPLDPPSDEAFDRLLVEPLAAAPHLTGREGVRRPSDPAGRGSAVWFDLGSGGGSPAIPLLIARPALHLTMIESKSRKAAFLREAVRELGFAGSAVVLDERFEDVASQPERRQTAELVTVRAVRADDQLFRIAAELLRTVGALHLFRPAHHAAPDPPDFTRTATVRLNDSPPAYLSSYTRVFHVEQSR
jgi:16S rRNA (guanine527-N7)-methyltransferase